MPTNGMRRGISMLYFILELVLACELGNWVTQSRPIKKRLHIVGNLIWEFRVNKYRVSIN
jgi:hypothetical protein